MFKFFNQTSLKNFLRCLQKDSFSFNYNVIDFYLRIKELDIGEDKEKLIFD